MCAITLAVWLYLLTTVSADRPPQQKVLVFRLHHSQWWFTGAHGEWMTDNMGVTGILSHSEWLYFTVLVSPVYLGTSGISYCMSVMNVHCIFIFTSMTNLHRERLTHREMITADISRISPMTPQPSSAYALNRTHTHTNVHKHASYIMDAGRPPQLFSLSQHQSSWCVTAAVGYCVTMRVLVCENEYGMAGFSPISFTGLGVSMASGFPEPKPLFLGNIQMPHLSQLTYAVSLSLSHIHTQERIHVNYKFVRG